jgi:hypothetical protein
VLHFFRFSNTANVEHRGANEGRGKFHVRAAASFHSGMDHVINLLSNHRIKMKIMTEETMAAGFASSFADHAGFVAQIPLGIHCLNPA